MSCSQAILDALVFAAEVHQYQRRSGYARLPYINHLIKVVDVLHRIGGQTDEILLQAAVLHDVVEDTDVTVEQLGGRFSPPVASIVGELTDDMELPYDERRRRQLEGAPRLSFPAKMIRLVDKGANIRDLMHYPVEWTTARKRRYVSSACEIVGRLGEVDPVLEKWFYEGVALAGRTLQRRHED